MKKTIPAKEEITCDICKYTKDVVSFATNTVLDLHRDGLDFAGIAVGPGGLKFDLCDACGSRLEWIVREAEKAGTLEP